MNSWNSRCPGLGSVVPSTLLALWSGRWPRIQTSAEGARTPALKIVQPFLSSDIIWYLKLSKYHQISFVCTDAPLLQFQDSKPVGIAFKSTKCHKQGYLYGSRHLSPSSFKIYFHHTSPYFNWNLKLGTGITGICRFAGRFFISNPWYCATPLRPAVARCPVESRRLIPGESGPRDKATEQCPGSASPGDIPWESRLDAFPVVPWFLPEI